MSARPPARMPSAPVAADGSSERPGAPWRTAGLALLVVWSVLLAAAVVLWVRIAFFPAASDDPHGYIALFGAPFALVAMGLLWWAWRSARALQRRRRDGFTLLLVLGGVAVAQTVMTAPAVVGAVSGAGTPGTPGTTTAGPPEGMVLGMLAAILLGLASVVVAVLARRTWPADDAADPAADTAAVTDAQR